MLNPALMNEKDVTINPKTTKRKAYYPTLQIKD
jgi:hypothetical protein